MTRAPTIGVLALQGDFAEHVAAFRSQGVDAVEVRTPAQLAACGSLVIPGGESTTIAKLMDTYALRGAIVEFAASGKPVWGTCAGMILLAGRLIEPDPEPLHVMDTVVQRNAFGRQVDSFQADIDIAGIAGGPFHAVFIRAPWITEAGPAVDVLARLDRGAIVAVRQGNVLATAFHPELTVDTRMHCYFAEMAAVAQVPA